MSVVHTEDDFIARRLPLRGTFNVRDVGGYPVPDGRATRWKTLVRGDALHLLDDEGRLLLAEFGIRTVVDLRSVDEQRSAPDRLDQGVRFVHIALLDSASPKTMFGGDVPIDPTSTSFIGEVYRFLVRTRGQLLVEVIRELAQPGALPAIVHCTAGKDRTGIVVALVLGVLGVPDEVIASDFAATDLFLGEEFLRTVVMSTQGNGYDDEMMTRAIRCAPNLLLEVLAEIREEHGDIEGYLIHHGLRSEELETLRSGLLDGDSSSEVQTEHDESGGGS